MPIRRHQSTVAKASLSGRLGLRRDEKSARDFVTRLFKNTPIPDTGGRAATIAFAQRGIGNVSLTFENEAHLAQLELGTHKLEIVAPNVSILAEIPVATVEPIVDKQGSRKWAEAYLNYLYSATGQALASKHFPRQRDPTILAESAAMFPTIELLSISEIAGSGTQAQQALSPTVHYLIRSISKNRTVNPPELTAKCLLYIVYQVTRASPTGCTGGTNDSWSRACHLLSDSAYEPILLPSSRSPSRNRAFVQS